MIPRANTARWRPAVKSVWLGRALKGLIGAVCLGAVAPYLAGTVFLYWIHADPKTATPLTIARYAYYYGHRDDVRQRLMVSSGVGVALVVSGDDNSSRTSAFHESCELWKTPTTR